MCTHGDVGGDLVSLAEAGTTVMAMDCEMVETTEATDALGESVFSVAKESLIHVRFFTLRGNGRAGWESCITTCSEQIGDSYLLEYT